MDWFLNDRDLRHERVNAIFHMLLIILKDNAAILHSLLKRHAFIQRHILSVTDVGKMVEL